MVFERRNVEAEVEREKVAISETKLLDCKFKQTLDFHGWFEFLCEVKKSACQPNRE